MSAAPHGLKNNAGLNDQIGVILINWSHIGSPSGYFLTWENKLKPFF